jgi:anti-sigma factor RsiW
MKTKPDTSLGEKLRDGSLYERAPARLRAQVLANLREAAEPKPTFKWAGSGWMGLPFLGGGVAGMSLCALAFMMFLWNPLTPRPDRLGDEIVASHVRALISSRAIDVVSTDQHTVKPWFNGRIDYAPPVIDLETQGFPLVGGRLDYVDHRPVAVLVYRYLKHPIDLYVFPDHGGKPAAAPTSLTSESSDGYSLVEWRQGGMVYWAISDASPVYIRHFADTFKAASTAVVPPPS